MGIEDFLKAIEFISSEISDILQSLLTPIIAIIAIYIAFQQYKTNKDKLRLNIFDKRFRTFDGLMRLYVHILEHGNVSIEALNEYKLIYKEGQFLFDKDIEDLLNQAYDKAYNLQIYNDSIDRLGPHVTHNGRKLLDEVTDIKHWFNREFGITKTRFEKYLRMK